jgi:hypothetical protein
MRSTESLSLPDIAYLVIDRKISYLDIDLLVYVPIILVKIKNNIFDYFITSRTD